MSVLGEHAELSDALVPRSTECLCFIWLGEASRAIVARNPAR